MIYEYFFIGIVDAHDKSVKFCPS